MLKEMFFRSVLLTVLMVPTLVIADTETVGGYTWKYRINGDTAEIYNNNDTTAISPSPTGAVTIPSLLGGKPVTSIGNYAFRYCSELTSVTIPNSVTSIGNYAFEYCRGLTSVTIPNSVTSIGESAFADCSGLTSVTIPDSVTNIEYQAFHWTPFYDGQPDGLVVFKKVAYGMKGTCPANVTIPDGVTCIGGGAFYYCSGLTSVTIPDSVTCIGGGAFADCSGLTSVTIPDSVTSIGAGAFSGCSGLTSVTIGNGVTSIGAGAFSGCSGLTNVHISDLAKWCGISFDVSYNEANPLYYAHNLYLNGEKVTALRIPDGVTSIGDYAFTCWSGLTSVMIPDSVTSIGDYAFYNCSGLTSVHITDLAKWCGISFGNWYANPLEYAHDLYLNGEKVTALTIPNSVTKIGEMAFLNCSGLTSVTIPDSVTRIGDGAFSGCSGLKDAVLPARWELSSIFPASYSGITNVTVLSGSSRIANAAFKGCRALTNINIPDMVTRIGDEAFYNCTSLQSLTIPDSVTSYGANCFEGCPAYTLNLYRAVFGGGGAGGGGTASVVTTVVQQVEAPYALTNAVADRAIASVTVNADCAIDSFVLKDGNVYDTMLYVNNTAEHAVRLSLPSCYAYKTIKGATPLTIPASSQCIISITRVDANVFLVMREELDDVK